MSVKDRIRTQAGGLQGPEFNAMRMNSQPLLLCLVLAHQPDGQSLAGAFPRGGFARARQLC